MILIVGALTFFPALSLGPVVEHFQALQRQGDVMAKHAKTQPSRCSTRRSCAPRSGTASRSSHRDVLAKNPVMFVVAIGSLLTTGLVVRDLVATRASAAPLWFSIAITLWLWFTVLFANFAEAVAEGRGKAQADTLRKMRQETVARKLVDGKDLPEVVAASQLRKGDLVVVEAGQLIPGDGEVVEGIASVDESAITGESAPVIRESGGDRSSVTGGTKVLSDRIVVEIGAEPGESFLDRMIALVEGAARQKTPNEIALHILLVGLTIVFLFACVTLVPLGIYSGVHLTRDRDRRAARVPDPDHDRRPALGDRHRRAWTA